MSLKQLTSEEEKFAREARCAWSFNFTYEEQLEFVRKYRATLVMRVFADSIAKPIVRIILGHREFFDRETADLLEEFAAQEPYQKRWVVEEYCYTQLHWYENMSSMKFQENYEKFPFPASQEMREAILTYARSTERYSELFFAWRFDLDFSLQDGRERYDYSGSSNWRRETPRLVFFTEEVEEIPAKWLLKAGLSIEDLVKCHCHDWSLETAEAVRPMLCKQIISNAVRSKSEHTNLFNVLFPELVEEHRCKREITKSFGLRFRTKKKIPYAAKKEILAVDGFPLRGSLGERVKQILWRDLCLYYGL